MTRNNTSSLHTKLSLTTESKPGHRELMEIIAEKLKGIFQERNLWFETIIFFNGRAYNSSRERVNECINPKDYINFHNPETVTVIYEGPLKRIMNYGVHNPFTGVTDWSLLESVEQMVESYGYRLVVNDISGFTIMN
ncbi:hypothetical protein [Brevibacillus reuszeri]|uniref:hypothetical protein n=1 Tax=Brevibacillus reuszeri TaxID=54915 RepID=UPI000CCC044E|nr:hypothetical protein [Brevibacillus reuszeri]